ncbi:MAG: hypothetical protein KGR99_10515 [Betaproteobacteria bacterium]|nr:hypothetical protein [Betaproteobacteria bacterium]
MPWPLIVAVRVIAWGCAIASATVLFGLVDLGTLVGLSDPHYKWAMPLEASWGALFTFIVPAGFVGIALAPRYPWLGIALLALTTLGVALGHLILGRRGPVWMALAIIALVVLGLALRAECQVRTPWRLRRSLHAWVLLAGAPLWLGYA